MSDDPSVSPPAPITSDAAVDGVDRTLILWMLDLTPAERLEVLQGFVDQAMEIRSAGGPLR